MRLLIHLRLLIQMRQPIRCESWSHIHRAETPHYWQRPGPFAIPDRVMELISEQNTWRLCALDNYLKSRVGQLIPESCHSRRHNGMGGMT